MAAWSRRLAEAGPRRWGEGVDPKLLFPTGAFAPGSLSARRRILDRLHSPFAMTTLIAPDEGRTETASPPPAPRLRLRRAGRGEQTIELRNGKHTIGSSPRCQVRLPVGESQPLQCLLSLEAGVGVVTRWATGVLVNGREFAKHELRDGDRLSIGPWEIEWHGVRGSTPSKPETNARPPQVKAERDTVDYAPPPACLTAPPEESTTNDAPPTASASASEAVTEEKTAERRLPDRKTAVLITPAKAPAQPPLVTSTSEGSPSAASAPAMPTPAAPTSAPPSAPTALSRPAAKTVLVSSRLTETFTDLLGPAKPAIEAAQAAADEPFPTVLGTSSSQAFEDRLLTRLWVANFAARTRGKALTAAVRKERVRAQELTAAIERIEQQLQAARAKAESQADQQAQLDALRPELAHAMAARDRLSAELAELRDAPRKSPAPDPRLQLLTDAVALAQREADELRETLAVREGEFQELQGQAASEKAARLAAEQEAARAAEQLSSIDVAAMQRALVEAQTIAERDNGRLRDQLYACESQIETLRDQVAEADAGRASLAEQLEAVQRQQDRWLAECHSLEQERVAALAEATNERDELQRRLEALSNRPAAAVELAPTAEATPPNERSAAINAPATLEAPAMLEAPSAPVWPDVSGPAAGEAADSATGQSFSNWASWEARTSENRIESADAVSSTAPEPRVGEPAEVVAEDQTHEVLVPTARRQSNAVAVEPASDAPASEARIAPVAAPAPEPAPYAPTSFIDKYRHLLEEDAEVEPSPRLSRPILDVEYLSPAQCEADEKGDDDSDEALEAYMSNMMRRVRGDGTSPSASQAASDVSGTLAKFLDHPADVDASAEGLATIADRAPSDPEIELDENGLLRLVRRPSATTDLAALRELANTSARSAIAQHRKRRNAESTVTKSVICVAAGAASATLLLTAPGAESPWFWGGCVTLVIAVGSAAQLGVLAWQRILDRRRYPNPSASQSPSGWTDFSPLTQAPVDTISET